MNTLGRTLLTACVLTCSLVLFLTPAAAQISAGGTPLSQSIAVPAAPTITMGRVNVQEFLDEDANTSKDVPYRFGAPFEVAFDMNTAGEWTNLPDGSRIWRLRIESRDAYSLNLVYDEFYMPEGAVLFLYNDDYDYVIGSFTSANNKANGMFSTQPVPGEATTLEYYEPADVRGQGEISIMRVVHAYRNMFGYANNLDSYGDSGSCNNNVACDDEWNDQERGVVMLLTSGNFRYCSGSLINNTNNDGTPFVLTADHCSPSANDIVMFNYQSPTCTNQDGPTNQTVSGTITRFSSSASDVWLMELSSPVPASYNPYFNGWNANDVPSTESVAIHHPSGDIKKISWDIHPAESSSYLGTSGSGDNTHWRINQWEDGTTEGGSSGSPLFDQNYRITGQLHGGWASCTSITQDYYGKFSLSMSNGMRVWLDPGNTGVMELDGFDPNVAGLAQGTVRDLDTNAPLQNVQVKVVGGSQTTFTDVLGDYSLPLADGTYDLEYSKFAYTTHTEFNIVITEGAEVTRDVQLDALPIITVLDEDFESGAAGWSHSAGAGWGDDWHVSTERANNGSSSYKCGDTGAGTYSNNLDARLVSPVLTNLPDDAQLTFYQWLESEVSGFYADSAYDGGLLEMSVNGGGFTQVTPAPGYSHTFRYTAGGDNPYSGPLAGAPCYGDDRTSWELITFDLSAYAGDDVQFRWRFCSDGGAAQEGWHIDDVLVQGVGSAVTEVQELTISVDGSDVTLRWADDINPHYLIFSGTSPDGPFDSYIGSTSSNSYFIANGVDLDLKFFNVLGSANP